MTGLIRQLGPLAVFIALFGALIGFLLSQGNNIGNWLLAAFLFGHGWIHTMYVMPRKVAPAATAGGLSWPFELSHSWLSTGSRLSAGALRPVGIALVGVTLVSFTLAALASVPLIVPASAWIGLIVVAAIASAVLMTVFFSPGLLLGLGIDAVLLYVALFRVWQPA